MKFFLDNCLPPCLAAALDLVVSSAYPGSSVVHLSERFKPNAADEEWIHTLGTEGEWIILTADLDIKARDSARRRAWQESGLTVFFFADKFAAKKVIDQAAILFRQLPNIVLAVKQSPGKRGFTVHAVGNKISECF